MPGDRSLLLLAIVTAPVVAAVVELSSFPELRQASLSAAGRTAPRKIPEFPTAQPQEPQVPALPTQASPKPPAPSLAQIARLT